MLIIRTCEEQVNQYIREVINIFEYPTTSYRVADLVNAAICKLDQSAAKKLKYHCDLLHEMLFDSIVQGFKNGEDMKMGQMESNEDIQQDGALLEELRALVVHNRAISIGFYYNAKGQLCLNKNQCIGYLQNVMSLAIINGSLNIYNHKSGIWDECSEELMGVVLRYVLNTAIKDSWKMSYEKEIYEGLLREVPRLEKQINHELLIPLENGVYDLFEHRFLKYDKKYFFTRKSPVEFQRGAHCPLFIKTISEIACNDEKTIACLQEIFGYTLIPNTKAEKAFYFTGVGSNGKSLCSEILTELVGRNYTSNIPLSKFSEKFGIEGLVNKFLNVANENEVGNAISTENLKAITSGDTINICRKYKTSIDYKPTVKLIFLLNSLPDTLDNTHGYYRKILIVPFNRIFREDEVDRDLKNKIISTELRGVLQWALQGASRLIKNNYEFTKSRAIEKIMQDYRADQNPVDTFLKEVLIKQEGASELKKDVIETYKRFLELEGIASRGSDSPQRFWKLLNNASKINQDYELEYKKIQGTLYLKNYRIDHSKVPVSEAKYSFSL